MSSLNIAAMVDELSEDIMEELDLSEEYETAVRALAYRWVQDKEETATNILAVALRHFQDSATRLPAEFQLGMAWAVDSLRQTIDHGLPVVPDEVTTADFLTDPLEAYGIGSDLTLNVPYASQCGETVETDDGETLRCERAPHSIGYWHVQLDEVDDYVYARWRNGVLEMMMYDEDDE